MPIGVKITEIDASLYSNSAYSNPCLAVIGTATKGPVGVPTLCTSQKDLKAKFGLQNPDCLGIYAANYFLAESNKCYYIRVAKNAANSSVNIPGSSQGTTTEDLLTLEATYPGTFYNGYQIVVEDSTEDHFSVTVKDPNGVIVVPKTTDVVLDETSDKYFGKILSSSKCISVKVFNGTSGTKYALTNGTYTLSGGDNGITGLTSSDYVNYIDTILPDTLEIELLAIPGVSDPSVIESGLRACEKRGDTIYIVDTPSGLSYTGAINWHNGAGDEYTHASFNSSYGAVYWSWLYIYDGVNLQEVLVPPSVVVPAVIARSETMSRPWFAPAGLTRGLIKNALRSESVPDSAAQDVLYSDPNNINPIITHPSHGLAVFGQKTLWRSSTSLDRINVRRLVTYIKKIVKSISQSLVFEPNDSTTWNNFQDLVDPEIRSIQKNRGLYEYKIIKGEDIVTDDDIDNYRMPAQILIKPTKTAEFIPIDIVITASGTNLEDYNSVSAN